eukprot:TRINITY_DN778_c0_g1_i5.p1 TRINITY_DN778_c0_g1~~TRINITY_DN778_c0_g1_i5.p1  ORF type:complete len:377 (-),score=102.40 TRINITY_DN778_c0_g1_i5:106-1203(-)
MSQIFLQNKQGEDIFLVLDTINKNHICNYGSHVLFLPKHCELCSKKYCGVCSEKIEKCCDEELTNSNKLAKVINKMREKKKMSQIFLQNKQGEDIFLVLDTINKNHICNYGSHVLFLPKHCELCSKKYCGVCSEKIEKCCDEELTNSNKLAKVINKMRVKCTVCEDEMTIEESIDHPQSKKDHVYTCEGCNSFKDTFGLLTLHQQQCMPYLSVVINQTKQQNDEYLKKIDLKDNQIKKLGMEVMEINSSSHNFLISEQKLFKEINHLKDEINILKNMIQNLVLSDEEKNKKILLLENYTENNKKVEESIQQQNLNEYQSLKYLHDLNFHDYQLNRQVLSSKSLDYLKDEYGYTPLLIYFHSYYIY